MCDARLRAAGVEVSIIKSSISVGSASCAMITARIQRKYNNLFINRYMLTFRERCSGGEKSDDRIKISLGGSGGFDLYFSLDSPDIG